jgi:hypothetical protein
MDEISNILTQLMFDLLVGDQVSHLLNPPNLIPAPKNQALLNQLRPCLASELALSEISINDINDIIS